MPYRISHIFAVQRHVQTPPPFFQGDMRCRHQGTYAVPVLGRDTGAEYFQGDGPVHRTRIHVQIPQLMCDKPGGRAFPRCRRAIDSDDEPASVHGGVFT